MWEVMVEWFDASAADVGILMTWPDATAAGGQALRILGDPPQELCDHEGVVLARRLPRGEAEAELG